MYAFDMHQLATENTCCGCRVMVENKNTHF
jgi:hypothetical protein